MNWRNCSRSPKAEPYTLGVFSIQIPPEELEVAMWQVRYFAHEWWGETPIRLHSREVGDDGAPRLHNDFIDYLEESQALSQIHEQTREHLAAAVPNNKFPAVELAVDRWRKLLQAAELLKATGNDELAAKLGESPEWIIMSHLGHELEELLKIAKG